MTLVVLSDCPSLLVKFFWLICFVEDTFISELLIILIINVGRYDYPPVRQVHDVPVKRASALQGEQDVSRTSKVLSTMLFPIFKECLQPLGLLPLKPF